MIQSLFFSGSIREVSCRVADTNAAAEADVDDRIEAKAELNDRAGIESGMRVAWGAMVRLAVNL